MGALGRPSTIWGYRTPEEYVEGVRRFRIESGRASRSGVAVYESGDRPTAYVSDGRWVCQCACGNCPSVDPDWRLAVCFTCGAILRPLVPPDVEAAEAALLARPHPNLRHYFPGRKEAQKWGLRVRVRARDLERENVDHGLPARRALPVAEGR